MMIGKLLLLGALLPLAFADVLQAQNHAELLAAKTNPQEYFKNWVLKHKRGYANDLKEFGNRFAAWMDNLEYVLEYNTKHTSHWLGMNSLADLTHEEYKNHYLGYKPALRQANAPRPATFMYANVSDEGLPMAMDWRVQKAVTAVKNQEQCGSCWAFSTTGAVEGVNAIVTNELLSLSEQELVDCDKLQDQGCSGGLMDNAFEFIRTNGGIDTEEDYPYTAMDGTCIKAKRNRKVVTIDGFEDVPENDEKALKRAAAHQPVAVAIEADQRAFQLYTGGVFADPACGTQLDHGVLVVGYGVQKKPSSSEDPSEDPSAEATGKAYWIVKNSWGPEWGDKGYIKIKMGVGKTGLCGIAMSASYPIKAGPNPPKPGPAPGPEPGPDPEPEPVDCDAFNQCPHDSTCCCLSDLFGMCYSWGCCPMPEATCCDDNEHCCPTDLPVCDTALGRCLPKQGVFEGSQPWATKTAAARVWPWGKQSGSKVAMGHKGGCHKKMGPGQGAAQEEAVKPQ